MATATCAASAATPAGEPNKPLYSDSSLPDWAEELGKGIATVMIIIIVLVFIVPAVIIVIIIILVTCGVCVVANRKKGNTTQGTVITPTADANGGKVDQSAATYPPPAGQAVPMQPVAYSAYPQPQGGQPPAQPVPYYDQPQPQPLPQQPVSSTTA